MTEIIDDRNASPHESEFRARDARLWSRWRTGDAHAASELIGHYEAALHKAMLAFGIADRVAQEDVYAETILSLARYKSRHDLESSFFGLARKILYAQAMKWHRRAKQERVTNSLDHIAENPQGPPRDDSVFREALEHCLQKLNGALERDVFCARLLEQRDNQEVARSLDKTPGHIAVILHGAVKKMRVCLSRQGFGSRGA